VIVALLVLLASGTSTVLNLLIVQLLILEYRLHSDSGTVLVVLLLVLLWY
jgi:hypothetical protein